jgi:hypothetical protein
LEFAVAEVAIKKYVVKLDEAERDRLETLVSKGKTSAKLLLKARVPASQWLDRRIPDKEMLAREVAAWQASRNKNETKANWRFTTADAPIKLKHLYLSLNEAGH